MLDPIKDPTRDVELELARSITRFIQDRDSRIIPRDPEPPGSGF
jgi:hypothetical protein